MKLRLHKSTLWAILAGLAYFLCFPQFDLPSLSLLFLPALLFTLHALRSRRDAWRLGFLLSALVAVGGFQWIVYLAMNFGQMHLVLALGLLLLFCLVAGPQMVGFLVAGFYLRFGVERFPLWLRPLFWAALYVGLEYLARFLKIFPEHLGNTLLAYPYLAQAAALGGVSLLSFFPLWLGASLYYLRKEGPRAWPSLAAALAVVILAGVWGKFELRRLAEVPNEILQVGIVQNNLDEIEKIAQRTSARSAIDTIVTNLLHHTQELATSEPRPDLIIWPETGYPIVFPLGEQLFGAGANGYANLVKNTIAAHGIPLLFGGYLSVEGKDFNSAILLNGRTGQTEGAYRKNVLLAFGEYFPGDVWFPSLRSINPLMGDFGRGPGPVPLAFQFRGRSLPLGVNICYEAILPDYMRGYARAGARVLVNITKDSWFGNTFEPWQHFQLSALRSIEHRLPTIRATNTGLSGVVLTSGASQIISPPFVAAAKTLAVPVPLEPRPTLYTLLGEWFAQACLAFASLGAYWALRKKGRPPIAP